MLNITCTEQLCDEYDEVLVGESISEGDVETSLSLCPFRLSLNMA